MIIDWERPRKVNCPFPPSPIFDARWQNPASWVFHNLLHSTSSSYRYCEINVRFVFQFRSSLPTLLFHIHATVGRDPHSVIRSVHGSCIDFTILLCIHRSSDWNNSLRYRFSVHPRRYNPLKTNIVRFPITVSGCPCFRNINYHTLSRLESIWLRNLRTFSVLTVFSVLYGITLSSQRRGLVERIHRQHTTCDVICIFDLYRCIPSLCVHVNFAYKLIVLNTSEA